MEHSLEVYNMGALMMQKVTPDPLLDYMDYKNTQILLPAYSTDDYNAFQVRSNVCIFNMIARFT